VKILISGGFGVGKTTTVGALSEISPLSTEAAMTSKSVGVDDAGTDSTKTTTTVAMDFGRVTIDESIILYMFGTPGQDRFGFMWNDLADGALGGIVLLDPSRLDDCFVALDYFDKIELPYVVAVNSFAGRTQLTLDQVRHAINVDGDVPVVKIDARDREQVKAVVLSLLNVILNRAKTRGAARTGS
jgi:signal recognition particle receptor subunit beta